MAALRDRHPYDAQPNSFGSRQLEYIRAVWTFRAKLLAYPDWEVFGDRFDVLFTAWKATPRTAWFRERLPVKQEGLLLIPSYRASEIEALSPGGWRDLDDSNERDWIVLVGRVGAARRFGLKQE
jgi:hypothetical protein